MPWTPSLPYASPPTMGAPGVARSVGRYSYHPYFKWSNPAAGWTGYHSSALVMELPEQPVLLAAPSGQVTSVQVTERRFAPLRSACHRSARSSRAPRRFASRKVAKLASVSVIVAPVSVAPLRSVWKRSVFSKVAP